MMSQSPKHIIVGMSGGVDSSVTALLLKEQGYHVAGLFMKNWEGDDTDAYCSASADMADAQAVCDQLGIELHRVNFASEYWERVFSHFLDEYHAGRTPNPDVLCNKEIKFKAFLDYATQLGAAAIATGHYARCVFRQGQYRLLKGVDNTKDQSYFLHALNQQQLAHSMFPLGELTKSEVRRIAQRAGFLNHQKKDSTGICFIGERKFKIFLNEYLPACPGAIETLDGNVIGQHDGLLFYTLGQRQGLKIGGTAGALEAPWYVAQKDIARNVLIVVQGHDHSALLSNKMQIANMHWITGEPAPAILSAGLMAKTRYRQTDQACTIQPLGNHAYTVSFAKPQRAVTPGQFTVFYAGEECLGGGVITAASL